MLDNNLHYWTDNGFDVLLHKRCEELANKMTDPLVVLSEDMELVSNMSLRNNHIA